MDMGISSYGRIRNSTGKSFVRKCIEQIPVSGYKRIQSGVNSSGDTFYQLDQKSSEEIRIQNCTGYNERDRIVLYTVPTVISFCAFLLVCVMVICIIQKRRAEARENGDMVAMPARNFENNREAVEDHIPGPDIQVAVQNAINYLVHQPSRSNLRLKSKEEMELEEVNETILRMVASGAIHEDQSLHEVDMIKAEAVRKELLKNVAENTYYRDSSDLRRPRDLNLDIISD